MSIGDALKDGPTSGRMLGYRSVVDVWLDGLPADDRADVITAMLDPRWSHSELNAKLSEFGLVVSDQQFAKARRRHGLPR